MAEEQTANQLPLRDDLDFFLQVLVEITNKSDGLQFGITLLADGFLVSGNLTSGKAYFESFAKEFSEGFSQNDPVSAESIKQSLLKYREMYDKKDADSDSAQDQGPSYIHLADAHFFNTSGKPIPGNRGVWWRGRLTEIAGFMLGSLRAEDK